MSQPTLENIKTPTISLHSNSESTSASHHLIFFITGNPGLVSYYDTFLNTLYDLLSPKCNTTSSQIHIYGQSLAGFEDHPNDTSHTPYTLQTQIQILLHFLKTQTIPSGPRKSQPYDKIILIGHSVGAYILLELIRHVQTPITAGILLFPTVTHISQSPSGIKISKLFRIPDFPRRASVVAKALVYLAPRTVLRWLVGFVTGMPNDAAVVTTSFLRSRMGVWQALAMAREEMECISDDRWGEEIWGVECEDGDSKRSVPKLVFYFGRDDHWVADHTRDALIAARGHAGGSRRSNKPVMVIDQDGVPHGFCIKHSEIMSEKVRGFIEEILES